MSISSISASISANFAKVNKSLELSNGNSISVEKTAAQLTKSVSINRPFLSVDVSASVSKVSKTVDLPSGNSISVSKYSAELTKSATIDVPSFPHPIDLPNPEHPVLKAIQAYRNNTPVSLPPIIIEPPHVNTDA